MKKRINWKKLPGLCLCGVTALELVLLVDFFWVYCGNAASLTEAAAGWLVVFSLICFIYRRDARRAWRPAVAIPTAVALIVLTGYLGWQIFQAGAEYQTTDSGKNRIYGNQRVMLIVPHQDDDINILGGALEEYARYGSELTAVFVTNGDYNGLTETRYREAVNVFESLGVPEERVIFLGYGDAWQEGSPHIYNAEPGTVMTSFWGRTETYGASWHHAYREGREYTIDNLVEDLKSVILEYRPDVIFCSDYDHHVDHKATTLLFDKIMGHILKENPEYRPVIYKAYAYGTAWEAEGDYWAENILSTQNLFEAPYSQKPAVYSWESRVRFPVDGSTLSRSLLGSDAFGMLAKYASQRAQWKGASVVNGDKVAWQRQTNSLVLDADITVSSGDGTLLNDFMLIENHDIVNKDHQPYDGVWIPDQDDTDRKISVVLPEPTDVASVVLYDHPSEEYNIKNARIMLENGVAVETGPLNPGGAATAVAVNGRDVKSFEIVLVETEGALAGLSEMEAFAEEPRQDICFVKLMDQDGNFLYDYQTEADGLADLSLYIYGELPALTEESYRIAVTDGTGSAVLGSGVIHTTCPKGGCFTLTVSCGEEDVSDSITIRNPGAVERWWTALWQSIEGEIYSWVCLEYSNNLLINSIPEKLGHFFRHLL